MLLILFRLNFNIHQPPTFFVCAALFGFVYQEVNRLDVDMVSNSSDFYFFVLCDFSKSINVT